MTMTDSGQSNSYFKDVLKMAPVFGVKALIADAPKATLESVIERKITSPKMPTGQLFSHAWERGKGRGLGAAVGIATAPLFIKGLQMASSEDTSTRNKGIALVAGSSGAFAGIKGVSEGYVEGRGAMGLSKPQAINRGLWLAATRSPLKIIAGTALGMAVASGRKKSKDGKEPSFASKYLKPAALGIPIGGAARGIERFRDMLVASKGAGTWASRVLPAARKSLPAAAGGAAGGIIGGLVLSGLADTVIKSVSKEKNSGVDKHLLAEKLAFSLNESKYLAALKTPMSPKMRLALGIGGGALGGLLLGKMISRRVSKERLERAVAPI